MKLLLSAILAVATTSPALLADELVKSELLIDDFRDGSGRSALGGYWQLSSDRVMGGISKGRAFLIPAEDDESRFVMKMTGEVRLENNGGFIQVRLPLVTQNQPLNAADFSGISLRVRGNDQQYFVHLRTVGSRLPWLYHYAEFEAPGDWTEIRLPFDSFKSDNVPMGNVRADRLVSIAVVAAKEQMMADIEVAELSFYE